MALKWCLSIWVLSMVAAGAVSGPAKVFVLAGQSNMEGQAVVDLDGPDYNQGKGTLVSLLQDSVRGTRFSRLRGPDGRWVSRDDVWVRYQLESGVVKAGPLTFGFTPYGDEHHFGPELQFGWVMGDALSNPVLLIKTAWGGKSLNVDFRPPSSGGPVGPYYQKMIGDIRAGLEQLPREFPGLADRGVELAGFVWYQGWNDGIDPIRAIPSYETNLVNLIRDIRRDLNAPHLPVVVGELTGPWVDAPPEWSRLRRAQHDAANHAEFAGDVLFVETHDFVRRPEDSPNPGHGHHEFGNAETYLLVGEAMGKGMLRLVPKSGPVGYETRTIAGWTVHVRTNLWASQKEATDTALRFLELQLEEILRVVPSAAVAKIREVPLWFSPPYPGFAPTAEYHPDGGWLREHGRNPAMAKGVEFTDISDFETEIIRMPNFALHELAHAYHDRVLGFESPEIQSAYEHAKVSGSYDKVERWNGKGRPKSYERAYAMTDAHEYFAESTEAYFSRNDFYPFTREELRRHDPEMFRLLEKTWNSPP